MSVKSDFFQHPLHVLVLAGGPSAERQISLESGAAVTTALRERGHTVTQFDPDEGHLDTIDPADFDVAFIALHGTFGEDGQVQQLLEAKQLPYTGSDVRSSRDASSKCRSKQILRKQSLLTPDFSPIHSGESAESIRKKADRLGYPLVVKPDSQGSSLGVTVVFDNLELPAALSRCFYYGREGLLENFIAGQEWTVGLIDDLVLPPIQIVAGNEFYDYDAKYSSKETQYLTDTDLPVAVLENMQQIARQSTIALGTRGIVRIDFRLDRFRQPWILEANTVPGMTSHSLIPKAAAHVGLSFSDVCEQALFSALTLDAAIHRPAA